jgi:hypothetical protein
MTKQQFETTLIRLVLPVMLLAGCSRKQPATSDTTSVAKPQPAYFRVDPATAASVSGTVQFSGRKAAPKAIDMSEDPACVHAHHGKPVDESLVVGPRNGLENVFVYIEQGLEGKTFATPTTPVVIDQTGCWFVPRVIGIQTGQVLQVVNSDPVTHNIHPRATINREWNHSQGPGDPPLERRFMQPEVMIPVKCNIHSWMHAYIGVLSHPYFTVSNTTGAFEIPNLPPGTYTIAAWQEKLGTQHQTLTVEPGGKANVHFVFHE